MIPSELGAYLQRHRDERGFSLEELEVRTRIRLKYLEAMEAGDWEALPPGVYTRGLLRNYARALGVSPASVLRMYIKERPSEARLPEPQLISQPLILQPRFNIEMIMAFALLAVAIGLFSWMVFTQLLPVVQQAGVDGIDTGAPVAKSPAALANAPTAAPTRTPMPRRGGRVQPLATATAAATATPLPGLEIEARAVQNDVWLRVQADGQEIFMGFLRGGESKRWSAKQTVRLRTGNAGDTEITLNGQKIEPLGDRGDVEERQWRLLANGDIEQSS